MQIEVLSISQPAFTKTPKGGYNKIEVAYKNDGKVQGKVLVDFDNKEVPNQSKVYEFFTNAKQGDVVDVALEKGEKYWNWTAVTKFIPSAEIEKDPRKIGGTPENSSDNDGKQSGGRPYAGRGRVAGSNYETPGERAARQRYIVRQSSVSNAITTLARDGTKALDPKEVIEIAKVYEAFVYGEKQESAPEAVGEEDVPF